MRWHNLPSLERLEVSRTLKAYFLTITDVKTQLPSKGAELWNNVQITDSKAYFYVNYFLVLLLYYE